MATKMEDPQHKNKFKNEEDLSPMIFKANRLEFGETEVKPASLNAKSLRERNKQKEVVQRIMINDLQIKGLHNSVQQSDRPRAVPSVGLLDTRGIHQKEKSQLGVISKSEKSAPPVVWGPNDNNKLVKETISVFPSRYVRDPSEVVNGFRDDLVIRLIKNSFKQLEKRKKQAVTKELETASAASRSRLTIQQQMIANLKTKLAKINAETVKQPTYSQIETERKVGYLEGKKDDSMILRHKSGPRRPKRVSLLAELNTSRNSYNNTSLGQIQDSQILKLHDLKEGAEVKLLDVQAESAFREDTNRREVRSTERIDTLPPVKMAFKSHQNDPIGYLSENNRFTRFKGAMEIRKMPVIFSPEAQAPAGSENEFSGKIDGLQSVVKASKRPQFAYEPNKRSRMQVLQQKTPAQSKQVELRAAAELKEDNLSSTRYEADISKSAPGFSVGELLPIFGPKKKPGPGLSQSNLISNSGSVEVGPTSAKVLLETPAAVHTYLAIENSKVGILRHKKMPSLDTLSGRYPKALLKIDTATGKKTWREVPNHLNPEFGVVMVEPTSEIPEKSRLVSSVLGKPNSLIEASNNLPQLKPPAPIRPEALKPVAAVLSRDKSADMHSLKSWSHHSESSESLGIL